MRDCSSTQRGFWIATEVLTALRCLVVTWLMISPWYNRTGWLGVKHQFTDLHGWWHVKLLPFRHTFYVHHAALHQFTVVVVVVFLFCCFFCIVFAASTGKLRFWLPLLMYSCVTAFRPRKLRGVEWVSGKSMCWPVRLCVTKPVQRFGKSVCWPMKLSGTKSM